MIDKFNAGTSKKHTSKKVSNELLQFQRHKNYTSTLQTFKINADKQKNLKPSLQNNGQHKKNLLQTQYQQQQHHYVAKYNND